MGVKNLQANVDSRLVANQVNGSYVAKESGMVQYLEKVKTLISNFKEFSIKQVPRSENKKADALSKIAYTNFAHLSKQVLMEELNEKSINEKEVLVIVEEEGHTWMTPICEYLTKEILPKDKKKARAWQRNKGKVLQEECIGGKKGKLEGTRDRASNQHSYCFNIEDDHKTLVKEMKSHDDAFWKKNDEMDSIMGNNTRVLTNLPHGFKPLNLSTPMDTSERLKPNNGNFVSQLEYSRVIGCLMYGVQVLEGYIDPSWISNTEDNSSTSVWVFLLGGGVISRASKK
ncbi:reverse transcriptase domain-containing protein [Tanacetum coccineum]